MQNITAHELDLSPNTVSEWFSSFREICSISLEKYQEKLNIYNEFLSTNLNSGIN